MRMIGERGSGLPGVNPRTPKRSVESCQLYGAGPAADFDVSDRSLLLWRLLVS